MTDGRFCAVANNYNHHCPTTEHFKTICTKRCWQYGQLRRQSKRKSLFLKVIAAAINPLL